MRFFLIIIIFCFVTITNGQNNGANLNDKMSVSARKEANRIIDTMINTRKRTAAQMDRLNDLGMDTKTIIRTLKGKNVVADNPAQYLKSNKYIMNEKEDTFNKPKVVEKTEEGKPAEYGKGGEHHIYSNWYKYFIIIGGVLLVAKRLFNDKPKE